MMLKSLLSGLCLALATTWAISSPTIVFDNGAPNGRNGVGYSSGAETADDFAFAKSTDINGAVFWGMDPQGSSGAGVAYTIFADNNGVPGASLLSGTAALGSALSRTETGRTVTSGGVGYTEAMYGLVFDSTFTADPDVRYWFGVASDFNLFAFMERSDSLAGPPVGPAVTNLSAGVFYQGTWYPQSAGTEIAFQLQGVVPTPSTILLVAVGALALVRVRSN